MLADKIAIYRSEIGNIPSNIDLHKLPFFLWKIIKTEIKKGISNLNKLGLQINDHFDRKRELNMTKYKMF